MSEVLVSFPKEKKDIYVPIGCSVLEAISLADIVLNSSCGGEGKCGKCKVRIIGEVSPPSKLEKTKLRGFPREYRLSCRTKLLNTAKIFIPDESKISRLKILKLGKEIKISLNPNAKKTYLEIARFPEKVSPENYVRYKISRSFPLLVSSQAKEKIKKFKKANCYKFTVTTIGNKLADLEEGNTTFENYGLAFDLGTTTMVGILVNLTSGQEIIRESALNKQRIYGEDIISRFNFAISEKNGLKILQQKMIETINEIIEKILEKTGINHQNIYEATFSGNSAMLHFILGKTPEKLAFYPFKSSIKGPSELKASNLNLNLNKEASLYFISPIASFVGGDTTSLILYTSLHESKDIKMAVDLGTNGEIAIGSEDRFLVASTSAGPAFEGATISCGMPAIEGAIERININDRIYFETIAKKNPLGLCGSGVIDALSSLLKKEIIDENGRISSADELKNKLNLNLRKRIREENDGKSFIISEIAKKKIYLNQNDIRQVQLAKGAIRAGIETIKRILGVKDKDLKEIFLSGAFGNYINIENVLEIGLLPRISKKKISFVGNASVEGAKMVLLSKEIRRKSSLIPRMAEHIQLGGKEEFQDEFIRYMSFKKGET